MITIEKFEGDLTQLRSGPREPKYPWRTMQIGDCFKVEQKSIRMQASVAGNRYGMKFVTKTDKDGMTNVIRIA